MVHWHSVNEYIQKQFPICLGLNPKLRELQRMTGPSSLHFCLLSEMPLQCSHFSSAYSKPIWQTGRWPPLFVLKRKSKLFVEHLRANKNYEYNFSKAIWLVSFNIKCDHFFFNIPTGRCLYYIHIYYADGPMQISVNSFNKHIWITYCIEILNCTL